MNTRFLTLAAAAGVALVVAIVGACSGGGSSGDTTAAATGGSAPAAASSPSSASSPSGASAPAAASPMDVTTYHNDIARTGTATRGNEPHARERQRHTFGKLRLSIPSMAPSMPSRSFSAGVPIAGGTHNVLYVATENAQRLRLRCRHRHRALASLDARLAGEVPSDDHGCNQTTPTIGITATPVIDRSRGPNGAMYVVGMSKDSGGALSPAHSRARHRDRRRALQRPDRNHRVLSRQRIGQPERHVPFTPGQYIERASLLLLNGVVYTAWSSHCDFMPYTGWVIGYSANTLQAGERAQRHAERPDGRRSG